MNMAALAIIIIGAMIVGLLFFGAFKLSEE